MVLNVGEGHHPPLPDGMPQCQSFNFTEELYDRYMSGDWDDIKGMNQCEF